LCGLSRHHELSLISFSDDSQEYPSVDGLRSTFEEIRIVPWKPFSNNSWRARLGYFHFWPRSFIDTFSPQMAGNIKNALSSTDFDLVIASEINTAAYHQQFNFVPALFEDVELGVFYDNVRYAKTAGIRLRNWLTWCKHRRFLASLLPSFRACTVVSEKERKLLYSEINHQRQTKIEIIPNCINLSDYQDVPVNRKPGTLIFTGSFTYSANYEAMLWFVEKVFPIVRGLIPSVQLIITGDSGGRPIPSLDNVQLAGFVPDIRPLLSSATASLAPIWTGGGTRLKILEAMALRTPVVSTSKGAEGLDIQHDVHLLLADTPESYADCVIRLLKDPYLQQQIGDNAYDLVRQKYDWAVVMPQFLELVESLV
jgi:polysaccharide biosynthesis protein PslH